ncbi:MAG: hypothetical protein FJZ47_19325 [Candidatus Tectomicrobia bacterium]|uniref:Uncharacterized protein n=1 Tax=Tectimicrobiota bacterium TaxID=2528274 RepID=A0A938B5R8_UNCTE|nr:hypothetical protein [Candidatus Tectomicrobia bacterium]
MIQRIVLVSLCLLSFALVVPGYAQDKDNNLSDLPWLTDKSRPLYFSSRFLVLKHKSRLPTFGILLL